MNNDNVNNKQMFYSNVSKVQLHFNGSQGGQSNLTKAKSNPHPTCRDEEGDQYSSLMQAWKLYSLQHDRMAICSTVPMLYNGKIFHYPLAVGDQDPHLICFLGPQEDSPKHDRQTEWQTLESPITRDHNSPHLVHSMLPENNNSVVRFTIWIKMGFCFANVRFKNYS